MRIYNKMKSPAFFRYAGRSIRGVDLKPREESPELPAQRMIDTSVQKDLRLGNIGVLLTQAEFDLLSISLPADLLAQCDISGKTPATTTETATVPFNPPPIVKTPVPEATKPADQPIVFEPPAPKPTVDPLKEEIVRTVTATAPAAQQTRLDQYKAAEQPAVAKAAEQAQQQLKANPPDGWMSKDEGEDTPPAPGQPRLDTSKYRGIPKYALFSEGVRRGLNVNPGMKTKELSKLLAEHDLKQQPVGAK
jgi:pyruvate/2-oxoglutarate dehydrogenase complex dihydrolipoamide acyltransferase (E2) component